MVPVKRCLGCFQRYSDARLNDVWIIRRARKNIADAGGEVVERQVLIGRIKRVLIPALTKGRAIVEIGMARVGVAFVGVRAHMFAVIYQLEIAVFFHDPRHLFAYKRA